MLKLLLSYLIHSTILISIVFLLIRLNITKSQYLNDSLLKLALVAAFFSVGLQNYFTAPQAIHITQPSSIRLAPNFKATTATDSNVTAIEQPTATNKDDLATDANEAGSVTTNNKTIQNRVLPKSISFSHFLQILIGLYFLIVSVLAFRVLSAWLELKQSLKHRTILSNTPQNQLLKELKNKANFKNKIKLSYSKNLNSPIALAHSEICLPERALSLGSQEQQSMLAHELSHLIRKDPIWLILATIIETLFFFQPLNRLNKQQLVTTSDIICDDFAIKQSEDNVSLAKCLATVASWQVNDRKLNLVSNMVNKNNKSLKSRVKRILSGSLLKPTSNLKRLALSTALFILMIAAVPKLDVIAQNIANPIKDIADIKQVWISTVGDLPAEFNEDYSELDSLPAGTKFIIEERFHGKAKKLVITEANGQKQYEYFVDGEAIKVDSAIIDWYQGLLGEWARAYTDTYFGYLRVPNSNDNLIKHRFFTWGHSLIFNPTPEPINNNLINGQTIGRNQHFFVNNKKQLSFYSVFLNNENPSPLNFVTLISPNLLSSKSLQVSLFLAELMKFNHTTSHNLYYKNEKLNSANLISQIEAITSDYRLTELDISALRALSKEITTERYKTQAEDLIRSISPSQVTEFVDANQETKVNYLRLDDLVESVSDVDFFENSAEAYIIFNHEYEKYLDRTNCEPKCDIKFPAVESSTPLQIAIFMYSFSLSSEPQQVLKSNGLTLEERQTLVNYFFTHNLEILAFFKDENTRAGLMTILANSINKTNEQGYAIPDISQKYLEVANTIQDSNLKQEVISALDK